MNSCEEIYYSSGRFGTWGFLMAGTKDGICRLEFENSRQELSDWVRKHFKDSVVIDDDKPFEKLKWELKQYFDKKLKNFSVGLDVRGTEFQKKVWNYLLHIPYGTTVTYKQAAQAVAGMGYSRAVGNAVNKNPLPIIIPCHRVIGSDGNLTGYASGLNLKEKLLALEGWQSSL